MIEIEDLYHDDDLMDAFRAFMGLTQDYQILPDDWQDHLGRFNAFRKKEADIPTEEK